MAGAPEDLGGGVWRFQAPLWQTNTVLAVAGGDALVCDPAWEPAEIDAVAAAARRPGGPVHLLVTHSDYDHVCGIGSFPGATVVAGEETAEAIRSGAAGQALAEAGAEWGLDWPGKLRVDRVAAAGETLELGPFRVESIEARGHVGDGRAWVLLEQGILLPGDYLSAMTYPFVLDSLARAATAIERLLAAIERHALRWVVPGHGPALTPAQAREVGESDLAYLGRVAAAAAEARANGLSPGHALVAVFGAVEPPRPTTDDFEVFGLRALNARAALREAA
jgi:glyoxylase-like metal-dependent hydrolase (beta-lactamase superfamily II)